MKSLTKCPRCGWCNIKTNRTSVVTSENKEKFVKKYFHSIKQYGMDRTMIKKARKEIKYSDTTVSADIASSVLREFAKLTTRSPNKDR